MSVRTGQAGLLFAVAATAAPAHAPAQTLLSPTHYEVRFEVDYAAAQLRGFARISLENRGNAAVGRASFLLYRLMRVAGVHDGSGTDLPFTQRVVGFTDFGQLQVNQLVVTLPKPLAPSGRTTIEVRYAGYLLGYAETGMRYIQDRVDPEFTIVRDDAYAYPRPGYPSLAVNRSAPDAQFTYAASITVPRGFTVANGGRRLGADTLGDAVTFRYVSPKPSWRMDFAIAKYAESSSPSVRVFYFPGDSAGAAAVAQAGAESLTLFTGWFGPPRDSAPLTFIEIPDGWGSQADGTTIIQSAAAFRDRGRHGEVYHEISHLWNVSPTDRPSPRWNEGLASFLEDLATQELTGTPVLDARANRLAGWLREQLPKHAEWSTTPLIDYGRARLTDLSYSVGNLYFDLLYRLNGRDTFNRIISRFATEFGASGGSTRDFAGVVQKTATQDMTRLNDEWLFTPRWTERVANDPDIEVIAASYRRKPDS